MKIRLKLINRGALLTLLAIAHFQTHTARAQNTAFTYQGRVTVNGSNFTGAGQFKFALVTSTNFNHQAAATVTRSGQIVTIIDVTSGGSGYVSAPAVTISGGGGSGATAHATLSGDVVTSIDVDNQGSGYTSTPIVIVAPPPPNISYLTYWSNDGTSVAGSEPAAAVGVAVSNGLFTVVLGDTTVPNMVPVDTALFEQPNLQLRIWFNDGVNGFAALSPLQNLTPAPYAVQALNASHATDLVGALPVSQLSGTILASQLPASVVTNNGTNLTLGGTFFGDGSGLTNLTGKQPVPHVINVKDPPYNAKGDGVSDDWAAIQTAITTASLATTNAPVSVYIPNGTYRLTNTLALTSAQVSVNDVAPGISALFGDGARRTRLVFTMANANGLEFRVVANDPRHLSNFAVHDLAIMGPAASANLNVTGSGYFIGYDANIPYQGDTVGWQDSLYNCLVKGWKNGLCISNTVFFTCRNCNFSGNVIHSVLLQHADTTRLENNNYGFPIVLWGDYSAIFVSVGTGVLNMGGECGNSACFARVEGGYFHQIGGNFERNLTMLSASNFCVISFKGCRIANGSTNYQFNFYDGGAGAFWAEDCFLDTTNVFNQVSGPSYFPELQIHHALGVGKINGLFDGQQRSYPPIYFQTPRWTHSFQLSGITTLNCNTLTPLSTSPSPFFSSDGLSFNNTTGQLWLHMPSGLGNNINDFSREDICFTVLIQGGTGATNATVVLNADAKRHDPAMGDVLDSSLSLRINGITNGMCKVFSWTNTWSTPTSDVNPRYVQLQFITTNQIYLTDLNAQTIDY